LYTKHPKHVPLPTKAQVLEFILESPGKVGKREIARAFNLTAEQRPLLRELMKSLEQEGSIQRGHKRNVSRPGLLPEVTVIEITGTDAEGELLGRPMNWHPEDSPATKDLPPPRIYLLPVRKGQPAVGVGDKVLARLQATGDHTYDARVLKRLAAAPSRVLGILDTGVNGLLLRPTDKRDKQDYLIAKGDAGTAEPGDLVECDLLPGRRFGLRQAQVVENLGSMGNPKAVSLIAIHSLGIPYEFTQAALEQAEAAEAAPMGNRVDLRNIPLVTIDGSDARDFDDAVWAEPDGEGGWHCLVAIADVAHYVRTDDALDQTAAERGNSVYFPDRVVPMLPEKLSNGWCSLRPNEDRPCMAVHFWIDGNGHKYKHEFLRGMMRSAARLTYEQVQAAIEGITDDTTGPLQEMVIQPLYGAFQALRRFRDQRGAL
jgi:ribonuclease R